MTEHEHEHEWVEVTTYGDQDVVEQCIVPGCGQQRHTPRGS